MQQTVVLGVSLGVCTRVCVCGWCGCIIYIPNVVLSGLAGASRHTVEGAGEGPRGVRLSGLRDFVAGAPCPTVEGAGEGPVIRTGGRTRTGIHTVVHRYRPYFE